MELCFVINLTRDGNLAITQPPVLATGYVCFATTFLYQVASKKKIISNTALYCFVVLLPLFSSVSLVQCVS